MSTIRSFSTGSPRIGSTVTRGTTSPTRTLHASLFRPSIIIASDPQMPWAHERRSASVPSWCHLTACRASSSRSSGSIRTVNSSHQLSCDTSGLNRRIFRVRGRLSELSARRRSEPSSASAALTIGNSAPRNRPSVFPLHRNVGSHLHGLVVEGDRAVGLTSGEGVLQPVGVVAKGVVLAVVGAATLGTSARGPHQRFGAVEQEPDLDRLHEVGVVDTALVRDPNAVVALAEALQDPPHLFEALVRAHHEGEVEHVVL